MGENPAAAIVPVHWGTHTSQADILVADYSGRVLEVTAAVGQIVREGQRLGAIETTQGKDELQVVAYYGVAEGKKIQPGMPTRVSPASCV